MAIRLAPQLTRLMDALARLPGIGPKTAQRLTFHLLNRDPALIGELVESLMGVRGALGRCQGCNTFSDRPLCPTCSDPLRDQGLLCVVESVADELAIDASLAWTGRYFVLNGRLNPIEGMGPKEIGMDTLLERIDERRGVLREVVIATSYTPEGDATAYFLIENIRKRWPDLRVTRLARGLPSGIEIEYTDLNTIASAVTRRGGR